MLGPRSVVWAAGLSLKDFVHRREDMLGGVLGEGSGKCKVRSPTFGYWCFIIGLKFVQFVERAEAIKKESEVGSTHRATQKHPGRCTAVCSRWSQQAKAAIRLKVGSACLRHRSPDPPLPGNGPPDWSSALWALFQWPAAIASVSFRGDGLYGMAEIAGAASKVASHNSRQP